MTPAEASAYLARCRGRERARHGPLPPLLRAHRKGTHHRVSGTWVFVRYGSQAGAIATDAADLEPVAGGT